MQTDSRIDLIIDSINAAASEVKPGSSPAPISDDDKMAIAVILKIFDKSLPQVVSVVIDEIAKQKGAAQ